jgi:hypothetical protein
MVGIDGACADALGRGRVGATLRRTLLSGVLSLTHTYMGAAARRRGRDRLAGVRGSSADADPKGEGALQWENPAAGSNLLLVADVSGRRALRSADQRHRQDQS